jgi:hypothetical protein
MMVMIRRCEVSFISYGGGGHRRGFGIKMLLGGYNIRRIDVRWKEGIGRCIIYDIRVKWI